MIKYTNPDLCALTEQVIFQDPYYAAPLNRHTAPQLDAAAADLRGDVAAKAAAFRLKQKFCQNAEALVHGDLHTGSIMVKQQGREGGERGGWCEGREEGRHITRHMLGLCEQLVLVDFALLTPHFPHTHTSPPPPKHSPHPPTDCR